MVLVEAHLSVMNLRRSRFSENHIIMSRVLKKGIVMGLILPKAQMKPGFLELDLMIDRDVSEAYIHVAGLSHISLSLCR